MARFTQTKNHIDFPRGVHFNDWGTKLTFDGHRLQSDGATVSTLTNDLPSAPQNDEVGWKGFNRLVLLTLPEGRGLWCRYIFREEMLQITYPHTHLVTGGRGRSSTLNALRNDRGQAN